MICNISSAKENTLIENVTSITCPTNFGEIQILPGHAEIFAILIEGQVTVSSTNHPTQTFPISGGDLHSLNEEVNIIL